MTGILPSCLVAAALLATSGAGQQDTTARAADTVRAGVPPGAPVVFRDDTLFQIRAPLGAFSAAERAAAVEARLRRLAGRIAQRAESVVLVPRNGMTDLVAGDSVLMAVTEDDAAAAGQPRDVLAATYAAALTAALRQGLRAATLQMILIGAVLTLLTAAALVAALKLLAWLFPRVYGRLKEWRGTRIRSVRLQRLELLSADRLTDFLIGLARVVRVALVVVLLYFFVPLVLSFFPWTEPLSTRILGYVLNPLARAGRAFVDYLPNLFFIAVIVVITRYALKLVHLVFRAIGTGAVAIPGFYTEWAEPTYKIVRFLILALVAVVLVPYLPGFESEAFRGISIFLGVLVSLGSASAVANVIAGVVLTYTRAFEVGDRVRIADTMGDVVEKTLLVTRVRTIKNVETTIPNGMVLGSHIINYSTEARRGSLILHSAVTISYDVPWRRVHELLITAARATPNVRAEPSPFVLQTSLDDFYVRYELNAYTDRADRMPRTYSTLHENIQDAFNEAGVEIMSPHYGALRDGNRTAIPDEYLPKRYEAPPFRVLPLGGPSGGGRKG